MIPNVWKCGLVVCLGVVMGGGRLSAGQLRAVGNDSFWHGVVLIRVVGGFADVAAIALWGQTVEVACPFNGPGEIRAYNSGLSITAGGVVGYASSGHVVDHVNGGAWTLSGVPVCEAGATPPPVVTNYTASVVVSNALLCMNQFTVTVTNLAGQSVWSSNFWLLPKEIRGFEFGRSNAFGYYVESYTGNGPEGPVNPGIVQAGTASGQPTTNFVPNTSAFERFEDPVTAGSYRAPTVQTNLGAGWVVTNTAVGVRATNFGTDVAGLSSLDANMEKRLQELQSLTVAAAQAQRAEAAALLQSQVQQGQREHLDLQGVIAAVNANAESTAGALGRLGDGLTNGPATMSWSNGPDTSVVVSSTASNTLFGMVPKPGSIGSTVPTFSVPFGALGVPGLADVSVSLDYGGLGSHLAMVRGFLLFMVNVGGAFAALRMLRELSPK